jgi:protein-S-isoprenylcysteine O-methyltransferase Ste14
MALVLVAVGLAATFGAAGTLRWPAGWTFLLVLAAGLVGHGRYVRARNPGLFLRRAHVGAETRGWDVAWLAVFWPLALAGPVLAGLDTARLGHRPLAAPWTLAGAALLLSGLALSARAMAVNPFFEGTARLQPDQRVVDDGPYRRIRHPGYAGLALVVLGGPLLLRSRWALAAGLAAGAWLAVRTALEDRMLRRGLPGYGAYAARVRSRLVPGLW